MRRVRKNAVKVSKTEKKREKKHPKMQKLLSSSLAKNSYDTIHLFLPVSGAVAGQSCHGDGGSRRKVNGPVNNGASASLHPVSEKLSLAGRSPC